MPACVCVCGNNMACMEQVSSEKLASAQDAAALLVQVANDFVDGRVALQDLRKHRDFLLGSHGSPSPDQVGSSDLDGQPAKLEQS